MTIPSVNLRDNACSELATSAAIALQTPIEIVVYDSTSGIAGDWAMILAPSVPNAVQPSALILPDAVVHLGVTKLGPRWLKIDYD